MGKESKKEFSSVQLLTCVWLFRAHGLQHTRLPCPSPTPRDYSNSCPLSRWCHPAISFSVVPFSSCLRSFPAWESFPLSQFIASGGQSIGVSASASVLPMNLSIFDHLSKNSINFHLYQIECFKVTRIFVWSKGDQSWVFIGRTVAEDETPILWPPHVKSWLIGKDPDAGRDWG